MGAAASAIHYISMLFFLACIAVWLDSVWFYSRRLDCGDMAASE
jgi:hypothetical protein